MYSQAEAATLNAIANAHPNARVDKVFRIFASREKPSSESEPTAMAPARKGAARSSQNLNLISAPRDLSMPVADAIRPAAPQGILAGFLGG
jgi:hypothetical protein